MTDSDTRQPFDPSTQELVLLVHGTFANNPKKSHKDHLKWWQPSGKVWDKINERLPKQFHVASDSKTEVFSWSGDNSERDRRLGGRQLFEHLQTLEEKGVRYHLVGHSHGGSVIWHCLLESVKQRLAHHRGFRLRRKKLDRKILLKGLRSFTTIGTPFLQLSTPMFKLTPTWLSKTSVGKIIDRVVDRIIGRMIGRLTPWLWMSGLIVSLTILGAMQGVYPQVFEFLKARNIPTGNWSKTVLEFLDPNNYLLLSAILKNGSTKLIFTLFLTLTTLLSMVMWAWASAVQLEASTVREGIRIRNQAFVKFGARWLGIWSRHDEAINGLKASLTLGGRIAPRIEVRSEKVFAYDERMQTYREFARWFVAPIFNLIIARPGDGIIWRGISRSIQGNDRPGSLVYDVSHGPIVPKKIKWEELPESYDKKLLQQSEDCLKARSTELFRQLREVLSQLAWSRNGKGDVLQGSAITFEGNELVHTCYFQEDAVLKAIACQIQHHSKIKGVSPDPKRSTTRWCELFRRKTQTVSRDSKLKGKALPLLGQSNRRAVIGLLLCLGLLAVLPFVDQLSYVLTDPPERLGRLDLTWLNLDRLNLNQTQATMAISSSGLFCVCGIFGVAWSSIWRAKRGAAMPAVARWGWRLARIALVLFLVQTGLAARDWSVAQSANSEAAVTLAPNNSN